MCHSKLQTEIALYTTEAEYVALLEAMRDVIVLMNLAKELKEKGFACAALHPTVRCKAFEDNVGAIKLARMPKMRPRTKHLNIKYHHFRSFVASGDIVVEHIATTEQEADILTKPLAPESFA